MSAEDLLTRTLHEVAEETDHPATSLVTVTNRARALRARRWRTTSLAAAAAVAVVVTPGAVWLSRSPGSSSEPTTAPTTSPGTASSGPTVATSAPPAMTLDAIPSGRPPEIDYLVGDTYVQMGGGRLTSPAFADATTAALGRGGILIATPRSGATPADLWLVTGGQRQALGCGSGRYAITPDRVETAYWLANTCSDPSAGGTVFSGADNTMGESGPGSQPIAGSGLVQPVGFVRQGVVVNADPATGPEVLVTGGAALAALVSAGGADDNADVVSGQLSLGHGRAGVVDAHDDSVLWQTDPGWQLGQFSTDGRYVVGVQPADGEPATYAIFDARTGDQVTTLDSLGPGLRITQVAWDESDSLLTVVSSGHEEAVVRFDLEGHPTRATPVVRPSASQPGYRLATRP